MSSTTAEPTAAGGSRPAARPRSWNRWATYGAAAWSVGYAAVAVTWAVTGSGFPMGTNDPQSAVSLLGEVPADIAAALFAAVALVAVVVALRMLVAGSPGRSRRWIVGFGAVLSTVLLLVVPDMRALALLGYLPMIVVIAPFDAGIRADVVDALGVQHAHQAAAIVGGVLWAAATLAFARRAASSCARCGRAGRENGSAHQWTTAAAAARWGRWAVYVAAVVPAIYAVTRFIWVAGVPLGIPEDVHADGLADGSLWAGAWLGGFALVGSTLTIGLIRPWGETFPRWVPVVRGRRVPIGLAVGPATFVAILATSAGLGFYRAVFADTGPLRLGPDTWAAVGPELLWPVWGVALAAAALAYHLRRRGACRDCGLRD